MTSDEASQQANEALRASETRARQARDWLQATLTSIGDAVIATDEEGRVIFMNPVSEALTGWTQQGALGLPLERVFVISNEETGASVENPVIKALRQGRIVGLANHTKLTAKSGREIPIDDSAAPMRDLDGNVKGVVLVFRDVSERKRAEQAQRYLAAIVESSDDAIIGKDLNGTILSWNKSAERIFGYSAQEAIGKPISIIAPPGRNEMPEILERIKRGVRIDHYQTVRRTKSGRLLDISLTVSPLRDSSGQIIGASKIARDISERKQAEERLRRSEEEARETRDLLRTTLASIGDAVIVTDAQGNVTFLNDVAAALTGWSEKEAVGLPLKKIFAISNEETGASVESPLEKVFREGRIVGLANHTRLTAKSGRQIPIDDSAAPIRDAKGGVVGVVLVFRDVTERKHAEKAVQESVERLSRANEDLRQFAFAASHDLQEPLRMITSYSQLLVKEYSGQLGGDADLYVRFISEGTSRMRDLLADLLAYAQLSSDILETGGSVDLDAVKRKAIENCKVAIDESKAIIKSDLLPQVTGHEPHFVQLLQNLIENAIKYRSDTPPQISISVQQKEDMWLFAVADNGISIAPEYHKQIFGLFKRLHGKQIPGTGIGLAICQRVVQRYGGKIWVESQLRQGSTFYFTLPVVPGE
jgi:PAS domain S-box-containing protein